MSTEGHFCWEDCDEGPHGCICGNDCAPPLRDQLRPIFWDVFDPDSSAQGNVQAALDAAMPIIEARIAAMRAEWEAEQGETEWEYARANRLGNVCEPDDDYEDARKRAERSVWAGGYNQVVRRRAAGPWLPVPDTGAEDEFAPGECDGSGTCTAAMHIHGCFTPHRSDQCDSPDEYGHIDTGAES